MAGIGDLIVKLKLNGTEFKKGLDKAGKDITSSFKNIKAGVMAVWSGIGAAAVSTLSNIAHLTQQMGDEWDRTVFKMKSTWSTFWRMDATGEYKNFFAKFKAAIQEAENLYNSRDAQFEAGAGSSLMRAMNAKEMNKLLVDMRDQNKTMEERNKAAERYLELLKGITTVEETNARLAAKGEVAGWLGAAGMSGYNFEQVAQFVSYLGNSTFRNLALGDLSGTNGFKMEELLRTFKSILSLKDVMNLASAWNANNDESTTPMVNALKAYYNSLGAYDAESRRIQQLLNSNTAKTSTGTAAKAVAEAAKTRGANVYGFGAALPGLGEGALNMSGLKDGLAGMTDYYQRHQDAYNEWLNNYAAGVQRFQDLMGDFTSACIEGYSNGIQLLMDGLFGLEDINAGQIFASLLSPLADMAVREGEILIAQGVGVEACKKALESLNGVAAIAAGASLVAIGAAAKAGLSKLASSGSASASTATTSSSSSSGSTDINSSLTIYVKGSISGSDIVLSGSKTIDKWNR